MKRILLLFISVINLFAFTPPNLSYLEEYDTRMYAHITSLGVNDEPFSCYLGDLRESRHTSYLIVSTNAESIYVDGLLSISPKVKTDKVQVKVMSGRCKGKYGWIKSRTILHGGTNRLFEDYNDGLEETILKLSNNFEIEKLKELHSHLLDEPKKRVQNVIEQMEKELVSAYKKASSANTIQSYETFLSISKYRNSKDFKNTNEFKEATEKLEKLYQALYQKTFESIKKENNIAGYEWFVKSYPDAPQVKNAIENIHKIGFAEAKKINTVSAYNTFIISYPMANEVNEANTLAKDLERYQYTDTLPSWFRSIMPNFLADIFNSIFGVFSSDEKKSRALLIKAKQVEREGNEHYGDKKAGYVIITKRMHDLLQEEFNDTDATLRFLESEEFKDFVRTFKSVMSSMDSRLDNIARYTSEFLEVSKQGLEEAKADRDMAEFYTNQHREWEKRMHFRDKGYQ